jgi:hypothetical protein
VLFVKPARWTLLCLFTGESGTKIVHAYFSTDNPDSLDPTVSYGF